MIIELYNVRARVLNATEPEHLWITDYLSWEDDSVFHRRRQGYKGSSYIRLYNRVDDTFPAGFTRMLARAATAHGFQVQVQDARVVPCSRAAMLPLPTGLRDYQVAATNEAARRTRGVVWAATGSGKTMIAMGLVESIPVRWLFLVNQTQLGLQARDRYQQFCGQASGVIAEGKWEPDTSAHGLTVATFQSLYSKLKKGSSTYEGRDALQFLGSVEGVIVDEVHVLPADSFRHVIDLTAAAYWRIGLSATPLARHDKKSMYMIGCLGSVVHRIPPRQLIDAKVLAEPIIHMTLHEETSEAATWQGAYGDIVVRSKPRNTLVCQLAEAATKPCVIFFKAPKQGKMIAKALAKRGHKVEYVDGTTATPVRQAMVTRLERGDTDILVASVVMNQGIDIPNLRSIVLAAGGSSTIAALQRVGRGMRRVPGKDHVDIYDPLFRYPLDADTGDLDDLILAACMGDAEAARWRERCVGDDGTDEAVRLLEELVGEKLLSHADVIIGGVTAKSSFFGGE